METTVLLLASTHDKMRNTPWTHLHKSSRVGREGLVQLFRHSLPISFKCNAGAKPLNFLHNGKSQISADILIPQQWLHSFNYSIPTGLSSVGEVTDCISRVAS